MTDGRHIKNIVLGDNSAADFADFCEIRYEAARSKNMTGECENIKMRKSKMADGRYHKKSLYRHISVK